MSGKQTGGADHRVNTAEPTAAASPLEAEQRRNQALRDELDEVEELAVLGVATRELLHDVANRLNQIMLQASILMMRFPQTGADLKVIREEGLKAAERLAPLQQRGRQRRTVRKPLDLKKVLNDLLDDEADLQKRIRCTPSSDVASVHARPGDLKRLLRLFLGGVLAETGIDNTLEVRTAVLPNHGAELLLIDGTRSLPASAVEQPFDSEDGLFAAMDPIDRMAMQVLLRETVAALQVRNQPAGGVQARIEWSQPA